MSNFRRVIHPGATYFFTVVTHRRRRLFSSERARSLVRESIELVREKRPFQIDAFVLLPEHLHCIWTLPQDDSDYSTRWRRIKERFTRSWLENTHREGEISDAQRRKGLRGVWQERFWEHMIRDERDYEAHVEYIFYNPVKHGHVKCPHQWPHSSFHRFVRQGVYDRSWGCECVGPRDVEFAFERQAIRAGE